MFEKQDMIDSSAQPTPSASHSPSNRPRWKPFSKTHTKTVPDTRSPSWEHSANLVSRIFFGWAWTLVWKASRRQLQLNDFPLLHPQRTSQAMSIRLRQSFDAAVKARKRAPLVRAIIAACRNRLAVSLLLGTMAVSIDYINIVNFYQFYFYLRQINQDRRRGDTTSSYGMGVVWILVICLVQALVAMLSANYVYIIGVTTAEVKTALQCLVSEKSFTTSETTTAQEVADDQGPATEIHDQAEAAEIHCPKTGTSYTMTLLTIHAERVSQFLGGCVAVIHYFANFPAAIIWLIVMLGWPGAIGILLPMLGTIVSCILAAHGARYQVLVDKLTDRRVTQLRSVLVGIRLVKYFAWEQFFYRGIVQVRDDEVAAGRRITLQNSLRFFASIGLINFGPCICYAIYVRHHGLQDNPAIIIAGLVWATLDRNSWGLSIAINTVMTGWTSVMRIDGFLSAPDMNRAQADEKTLASDVALQLSDAAFSWGTEVDIVKDVSRRESAEVISTEKLPHADIEAVWTSNRTSLEATFTLAPVSLELRAGELVALVGATQAGKSSLLSGLVGSMPLQSGLLHCNDTPAYCPSSNWIQSASLRENVIFGQPVDEQVYQDVLDACALKPDLDTFARRDLTQLGEEGVRLSGGQKTRVSLARTVYQAVMDNRKLVLLDDPLSAVDAHTCRKLFDHAIAGLLGDKCCLLVTHQLHVLPNCDRILYMRDGRIVADGTYTDLVKRSDFATFLGEGSSKQEAEDDQATEKTEGSRVLDFSQADAAIVEDEERASHKVPFKLYLAFVPTWRRAVEFLSYKTLLVISQMAFTLISLQTAWWTSNCWNFSYGQNLGLYLGFAMAHTLTWSPYNFLIQSYMLDRSHDVSQSALAGLLKAPIAFYYANPVGRLLNRFTDDISILDTLFPRNYFLTTLLCTYATATLAIVISYVPIVAALLVPWIAVGALIFWLYKSTPLEIKRVSVTLSSVYLSLLHQGLAGRKIIELAKNQQGFCESLFESVDNYNSVHLLSHATFAWATIAQRLTHVVFMFCGGLLIVSERFKYAPAILVVVYALLIVTSAALQGILDAGSQCQRGLNAMERLQHFSHDLPAEEEAQTYDEKKSVISENWPSKGQIDFEDVHLKYRKDLPMALEGLSFGVLGGEKLGVVGRTGAGKSTLLMAVLRLVNLAKGRIVIDGVETSHVDLKTLRDAIAVIPQDPVMFPGPLRFNLDPSGRTSDEKMLEALEQVHLIGGKTSENKPVLTLDTIIQENGQNFSSGERQLVSLARALAKGSKIIMIDEATSNVDLAKDLMVQQTIRECFADCTVITIAHRLKTVLGSDKILVMDQGHAAEFGPPMQLYKEHETTGGWFRGLCDQARIAIDDFP